MSDKQWTLRQTPEREKIIEELRQLLSNNRPGEGERIHGVLTTAQIMDWALEDLLSKMRSKDVDRLFS